jgi:hypothetical protein
MLVVGGFPDLHPSRCQPRSVSVKIWYHVLWGATFISKTSNTILVSLYFVLKIIIPISEDRGTGTLRSVQHQLYDDTSLCQSIRYSDLDSSHIIHINAVTAIHSKILTCLISRSRVLLDNFNSLTSQQTRSTLWNLKVHYSIHNSPQLSLSRATLSQVTFPTVSSSDP